MIWRREIRNPSTSSPPAPTAARRRALPSRSIRSPWAPASSCRATISSRTPPRPPSRSPLISPRASKTSRVARSRLARRVRLVSAKKEIWEGHCHAAHSSCLGGGELSADARRHADSRPEAGRYPDDVSPRQPGKRLHPRGGDLFQQRAVHARVQQPRHLQTGCCAEQLAVDRSRPGDELVVERRQHQADLCPA